MRLAAETRKSSDEKPLIIWSGTSISLKKAVLFSKRPNLWCGSERSGCRHNIRRGLTCEGARMLRAGTESGTRKARKRKGDWWVPTTHANNPTGRHPATDSRQWLAAEQHTKAEAQAATKQDKRQRQASHGAAMQTEETSVHHHAQSHSTSPTSRSQTSPKPSHHKRNRKRCSHGGEVPNAI